MGDFGPVEPRQVEASELLHRVVDKSYEDLRTLLMEMPKMREEERREPLLTHLQTTRTRFAQLLAVLKWSVQSPLMQQCDKLLEQGESYRNQVNETNDRLFFMHADLNRAKERQYDLSTAVDVLYGGSYLRFPTIAKYAMFPRELPPVDTDAAAKEVEDIIRFRLIEAVIPEQFTSIELEGGFATCIVDGEFEIVLTIQGKEKDSLWRVISVNTAITDPRPFEKHSKLASTSSLRIIKSSAPSPVHYNHLKNLVQRTMNKSDAPFVDAFKVMREFCSSLALQVLFAQGKLLMEGRWKNRILVKYHREHNVLDFCYFPKVCVKKDAQSMTDRQRLVAQVREASNAFRQKSQSWPPFPESSLCLRLAYDDGTKALLTATLSPLLPPNLTGKEGLLKALQVPSNLFMLSAENLLIAGMRAHASAAVFTVGRMVVMDAPDDSHHAQLMTGEKVRLGFSGTTLNISRADIGGLDDHLRITFDIREGNFVADSSSASKNPTMQRSVAQLEKVLNDHCKIEVCGGDKTHATDFAMLSRDGDNERANELIHSSLHQVLCELAVQQIAEISMSLKDIRVRRHLNLSWDRYINFRQQQGGSTEDLLISNMALFLQLTSSKESACYLVIEVDKYAGVDGISSAINDSSRTDQYVRLPCFSLLRTNGGNSTTAAGVQFIQRFPAFKREDLHQMLHRSSDVGRVLSNGKRRPSDPSLSPRPSKKAQLFGGGPSVVKHGDIDKHPEDRIPHVASVLLHVINMCRESIQLQHFVNFTRRRRLYTIRYSGEAKTANDEGTGRQVVTLTFPENPSAYPLKIQEIQGYLKYGGGFELCLKLAQKPFTFIRPKCKVQQHLLAERKQYVNEQNQLIFRYPPTALVGDANNENPLEVFMVDLLYVVKPLCELGVKLESILSAFGRYTNEIKDDGHFYVESADPFAIVLACRTTNPRRTIAAGSSVDGMVTYRATIQFKQKMGFVVNYSHKAEHPLMHFIQSALTAQNDPAQLVEALERTCIPMGILASAVESRLLSAKYYRHEPTAQSNGLKAGGGGGGKNGKMGGKGIKLNYKIKLPGEETRYYAEKSYGGDDKSFVPAELVLIPRSQTHLRLSYGDRCAVDIYFMGNRKVKMQSSPGGVRVPSCPPDRGLIADFSNFGDKLCSTLSEMALL